MLFFLNYCLINKVNLLDIIEIFLCLSCFAQAILEPQNVKKMMIATCTHITFHMDSELTMGMNRHHNPHARQHGNDCRSTITHQRQWITRYR